MSDGLNMLDRVGEPETSIAGAEKLMGGVSAFAAPNIPDTSGPGPAALQEPPRWVYDFDPANGSSRATFNGEVVAASISTPAAGVSSFNTRTGAVVLTTADVQAAGALANPSPSLSGSPTAPTPAPGNSSTLIATTQFVAQAIAAGAGVVSFNGRQGAITLTSGDVTGAGGAPAASPALTGVPTAPTAAQGDASSQIATDAFVANALASGTVTTFNGRRGAVSLTLSDVQSVGGAPIASPVFTGVPAVPTAAPGTATTQAASTQFVTNAVSAATAGVSSVNTRTGAVVLNASDLAGMGGAPLNSPVLTGNPAAPTPTAGDNSTRIATTAYVETAIGSLPPGVATFNGRQGTVTLQLTDVTSVGGAPLASPTFTGSPLTTTPAPGDNSTRIADTAFVAASFAPISSVPLASTATPLMNGTASAGSAAAWSRGDHVHPTDTSRAAATALANYLPLSGGVLSGSLRAATSLICQAGAGANANVVWNASNGAQCGIIYFDMVNNNFNITNSTSSAFIQIDNGGVTNFSYLVNPTGWIGRQGTAGGGGGQPNNFFWDNANLEYWVGTVNVGNVTLASDYRMKKDVRPLAAMWGTVKALRPVSYSHRDFTPPSASGVEPYPERPPLVQADDIERWGFLAHELQETLTRSAATGVKDAPDLIQSPNPWTVIAALTTALQEAMRRIEALEAQAAGATPYHEPP